MSYSIDDPWSATSPNRHQQGASSSSNYPRPLTWAPSSSVRNGAADAPSSASSDQDGAGSASYFTLRLPPAYQDVWNRASAEDQDDGEAVDELSLSQLRRVVGAARGLSAGDVEEVSGGREIKRQTDRGRKQTHWPFFFELTARIASLDHQPLFSALV